MIVYRDSVSELLRFLNCFFLADSLSPIRSGETKDMFCRDVTHLEYIFPFGTGNILSRTVTKTTRRRGACPWQIAPKEGLN